MDEIMEDREVGSSKGVRAKKGLLTITTDDEPYSSVFSRRDEDFAEGRFQMLDDSKTVRYGDGSAYCGQTSDGQRHGEGVYKCGTEQYEGQWLYDRQHGTGRQLWSDGRSYTGQYDCGRFSGRGRMIWQTEKGMMVYEGEYMDDMKHGCGRFGWPDGRVYTGEWHRGKRHGRGSYKTARGEHKVGHWMNDRFLRWEAPQLDEDDANIMLR